ncbi:MAG: hypothetical protein AAGH78_01310 [Cyanobacteria bacterium P01_H01_bin.58]
MDLNRAKELSKTVPVPEFSLGDVVKIGQQFGIIIGIQAWEDDDPSYLTYAAQVIDPGPYEDDDGKTWDTFSAQESHIKYCVDPRVLELVFSPRSTSLVAAGLNPA